VSKLILKTKYQNKWFGLSFETPVKKQFPINLETCVSETKNKLKSLTQNCLMRQTFKTSFSRFEQTTKFGNIKALHSGSAGS
jgi:hypothetical protein